MQYVQQMQQVRAASFREARSTPGPSYNGVPGAWCNTAGPAKESVRKIGGPRSKIDRQPCQYSGVLSRRGGRHMASNMAMKRAKKAQRRKQVVALKRAAETLDAG